MGEVCNNAATSAELSHLIGAPLRPVGDLGLDKPVIAAKVQAHRASPPHRHVFGREQSDACGGALDCKLCAPQLMAARSPAARGYAQTGPVKPPLGENVWGKLGLAPQALLRRLSPR